MIWTREQFEQHKETARRLIIIKDVAFKYLKINQQTNEYELRRFIFKEYKKNNLVTDKHGAIVNFRENTQYMHSFRGKNSKRLEPNSLILLDIWARLRDKDAPYADITWMAYYGKKVPAELKKLFSIVTTARDRAIRFLEKKLKQGKVPLGKELDASARNYIRDKGYGPNFIYTLGHTLGTTNCHGNYRKISPRNNYKVMLGIGYTIEPGIYLKNRFGIRSEINFYINSKMKLVVTTPVQRDIIIINNK